MLFNECHLNTRVMTYIYLTVVHTVHPINQSRKKNYFVICGLSQKPDKVANLTLPVNSDFKSNFVVIIDCTAWIKIA